MKRLFFFTSEVISTIKFGILLMKLLLLIDPSAAMKKNFLKKLGLLFDCHTSFIKVTYGYMQKMEMGKKIQLVNLSVRGKIGDLFYVKISIGFKSFNGIK